MPDSGGSVPCHQGHVRTYSTVEDAHDISHDSGAWMECGLPSSGEGDLEAAPFENRVLRTTRVRGHGQFVTVVAVEKADGEAETCGVESSTLTSSSSSSSSTTLTSNSSSSSSSSSCHAQPATTQPVPKAAPRGFVTVVAVGSDTSVHLNHTGTITANLKLHLVPGDGGRTGGGDDVESDYVNQEMIERERRTVNPVGEPPPTPLESGVATPSTVPDQVVVYRLPGERLGLGLKFDGGMGARECVKRLFIQSVAPDSPAARAAVPWGELHPGDQILNIEGCAVSSMTRVQCVSFLKDAAMKITIGVLKGNGLLPADFETSCGGGDSRQEYIRDERGGGGGGSEQDGSGDDSSHPPPLIVGEMRKRVPPPPLPPRSKPRKSPARPPKDPLPVPPPPSAFQDMEDDSPSLRHHHPHPHHHHSHHIHHHHHHHNPHHRSPHEDGEERDHALQRWREIVLVRRSRPGDLEELLEDLEFHHPGSWGTRRMEESMDGDMPPIPAFYHDLVGEEDAMGPCESESDETNSSVSTVVDRLSLSSSTTVSRNSSFNATADTSRFDLARALSPFEQLEKELETENVTDSAQHSPTTPNTAPRDEAAVAPPIDRTTKPTTSEVPETETAEASPVGARKTTTAGGKMKMRPSIKSFSFSLKGRPFSWQQGKTHERGSRGVGRAETFLSIKRHGKRPAPPPPPRSIDMATSQGSATVTVTTSPISGVGVGGEDKVPNSTHDESDNYIDLVAEAAKEGATLPLSLDLKSSNKKLEKATLGLNIEGTALAGSKPKLSPEYLVILDSPPGGDVIGKFPSKGFYVDIEEGISEAMRKESDKSAEEKEMREMSVNSDEMSDNEHEEILSIIKDKENDYVEMVPTSEVENMIVGESEMMEKMKAEMSEKDIEVLALGSPKQPPASGSTIEIEAQVHREASDGDEVAEATELKIGEAKHHDENIYEDDYIGEGVDLDESDDVADESGDVHGSIDEGDDDADDDDEDEEEVEDEEEEDEGSYVLEPDLYEDSEGFLSCSSPKVSPPIMSSRRSLKLPSLIISEANEMGVYEDLYEGYASIDDRPLDMGLERGLGEIRGLPSVPEEDSGEQDSGEEDVYTLYDDVDSQVAETHESVGESEGNNESKDSEKVSVDDDGDGDAGESDSNTRLVSEPDSLVAAIASRTICQGYKAKRLRHDLGELIRREMKLEDDVTVEVEEEEEVENLVECANEEELLLVMRALRQDQPGDKLRWLEDDSDDDDNDDDDDEGGEDDGTGGGGQMGGEEDEAPEEEEEEDKEPSEEEEQEEEGGGERRRESREGKVQREQQDPPSAPPSSRGQSSSEDREVVWARALPDPHGGGCGVPSAPPRATPHTPSRPDTPPSRPAQSVPTTTTSTTTAATTLNHGALAQASSSGPNSLPQGTGRHPHNHTASHHPPPPPIPTRPQSSHHYQNLPSSKSVSQSSSSSKTNDDYAICELDSDTPASVDELQYEVESVVEVETVGTYDGGGCDNGDGDGDDHHLLECQQATSSLKDALLKRSARGGGSASAKKVKKSVNRKSDGQRSSDAASVTRRSASGTLRKATAAGDKKGVNNNSNSSTSSSSTSSSTTSASSSSDSASSKSDSAMVARTDSNEVGKAAASHDEVQSITPLSVHVKQDTTDSSYATPPASPEASCSSEMPLHSSGNESEEGEDQSKSTDSYGTPEPPNYSTHPDCQESMELQPSLEEESPAEVPSVTAEPAVTLPSEAVSKQPVEEEQVKEEEEEEIEQDEEEVKEEGVDEREREEEDGMEQPPPQDQIPSEEKIEEEEEEEFEDEEQEEKTDQEDVACQDDHHTITGGGGSVSVSSCEHRYTSSGGAPPPYSRLPPDGHEFPSSYAEGLPDKLSRYARYSRLAMELDSPGSPTSPPVSTPRTRSAPGTPLGPPPPIPRTSPNSSKTERSSDMGGKWTGGDERKSREHTPTRGRWRRQDERSERSVRDKIAMFSTDGPDQPHPKTRKLDKVDGDEVTMKRAFTEDDVRLENSGSSSNESGRDSHNGSRSLSKTSAFSSMINVSTSEPKDSIKMMSTASSEVDIRQEMPPVPRQHELKEEKRKDESSSTSTGLHSRSQSLIDIGRSSLTKRHSVGAYDRPSVYQYGIEKPEERERRTSLSNLIEQRRKSLSKLRGLVIPESRSNEGDKAAIDLPKISSVPPSSNLKTMSLPREGQRSPRLYKAESISSIDSCESNTSRQSSLNAPPWKNHNTSTLPKYSPAFKRKNMAVFYKCDNLPPPSGRTHSTRSTSPTSDLSQASPVPPAHTPTPPRSLETITTPSSEHSFEFCENRYSNEKHNYSKLPLSQKSSLDSRLSRAEDSDNDSAVSSTQSSFSQGMSPPSSPMPEHDDHDDRRYRSYRSRLSPQSSYDEQEAARRVLKRGSIEAENRRNVLNSARCSSGRSSDEQLTPEIIRKYSTERVEETDKFPKRLDSELRDGPKTLGLRRHPSTSSTSSAASSRRSSHDSSRRNSRDSVIHIKHEEKVSAEPVYFDQEGEMYKESQLKVAYLNEIMDDFEQLNDPNNEEVIAEIPLNTSRRVVEHAESTESSPSVPTGRRSERWAALEMKYGSSKADTDIESKIQRLRRTSDSISPDRSRKNSNGFRALAERWQQRAEEETTAPQPQLVRRESASRLDMPARPSRLYDDRGSVASTLERPSRPSRLCDEPSELDSGRPTRPTCLYSESTQSSNSSSSSGEARTGGLDIPRAEVPDRKLSMPEYGSGGIKLRERREANNGGAPSRPTSLIEGGDSGVMDSHYLSAGGHLSPTVSTDSRDDLLFTPEDSLSRTGSKEVLDAFSRPKASISISIPRSGASNTPKMSDIMRAFERHDLGKRGAMGNGTSHPRMSSLDSTTSDDGSLGAHYGSVTSLASGQRDQYGSITSLASSTSLISPQELQQLIEEANQSLEESGTPSHEILVVVLHREIVGHGSIGITLAGGADYEAKEITVHKVIPGSLADRDGRIQRGDRVLSINGKNLRGVTHREALNILKSPRPEVVLVLSRSRSVTPQESNLTEGDGSFTHRPLINHVTSPRPPKILESPMDSKSLVSDAPAIKIPRGPPLTITLMKDGAGLGFSLEGGKDSPLGDRPLTVKKIFSGGAADKGGILKVGDELVSVNAVDVTGMARIEAWNFLKKLPDGTVSLVLRQKLEDTQSKSEE